MQCLLSFSALTSGALRTLPLGHNLGASVLLYPFLPPNPFPSLPSASPCHPQIGFPVDTPSSCVTREHISILITYHAGWDFMKEDK